MLHALVLYGGRYDVSGHVFRVICRPKSVCVEVSKKSAVEVNEPLKICSEGEQMVEVWCLGWKPFHKFSGAAELLLGLVYAEILVFSRVVFGGMSITTLLKLDLEASLWSIWYFCEERGVSDSGIIISGTLCCLVIIDTASLFGNHFVRISRVFWIIKWTVKNVLELGQESGGRVSICLGSCLSTINLFWLVNIILYLH